MCVHRPIGVLELGPETCSSCDPERYGVPCCFTAEQEPNTDCNEKLCQGCQCYIFSPKKSILFLEWKMEEQVPPSFTSNQ